MQDSDFVPSTLGTQVPATVPEQILLALGLTPLKISQEDLKIITSLPRRAREDLLIWHALLEPLLPATGRPRLKGIQAKLEEVARKAGEQTQKVRRRYDRFRKSGWRGLVNRSLAGPAWYDRHVAVTKTIAERPAFIDFWQSLQQQSEGRDQTGLAAHSALKRRLLAWENGDDAARIPGYDTPPTREPRTDLPKGWTYDNLMRLLYRLPEDEAAAAKYGCGALLEFRLPVLSTREGLKVGQIYVFDDQEVDTRTNYLGVATQSFRPLCFDAQDYLSTAQPLHGYKAVLIDSSTGKRRNLTKQDFQWFVVALLTTVGYRRDTGTTLLVEHGTAAISKEFESRILLATDGMVKVDRGGIAGQPTYPGMFEGQRRGNFRFKATLESARVRFRNEMALQPGAVGKDRNHAPEADYGLDRYNQKYLDAAIVLPPELAARLQFPILDWREFVAIASSIHRIIDSRTDHDLEGWERCRFIKYEYRMSPKDNQWLDAAQHFATMDERQRQAVCAHVQSAPGLWRTRKMSPQEVWDAGKNELVVVPHHALPILMGPEEARRGERCEKNKLFILKDKMIDAEPLHYDASALVRQGCVVPGEYYTVYLNPFAPDRLVVCDASLRYKGMAPLWERIARLDKDEAAKRIAHARRHETAALNNLARRGSQKTRRMLGMVENNVAVITGHSSSEESAVLEAVEQVVLLPDSSPTETFLLPPPSRPRPPDPPPKAEEDETDDLALL